MNIKQNLVMGGAAPSSFWDIQGYQPVVERVRRGHDLCDELFQMIEQRKDLENQYATSLRAWAGKWLNGIDKSIAEMPSMKQGWSAFATQAADIGAAHVQMCEELRLQVLAQIKQYKHEHYHRSLLSYREKKECDEQFRNAQKKWADLLQNMQSAFRKFCDAACLRDKQAQRVQEQQQLVARGTALQNCADLLRNEQIKLEKCKALYVDRENLYKSSLKNLSDNKDSYMQEMHTVFLSWQKFEKERMDFFKILLISALNILDFSKKQSYIDANSKLRISLQQIDINADLNKFDVDFGTKMNYEWPFYKAPNSMIQKSSLSVNESSSYSDINKTAFIGSANMINYDGAAAHSAGIERHDSVRNFTNYNNNNINSNSNSNSNNVINALDNSRITSSAQYTSNSVSPVHAFSDAISSSLANMTIKAGKTAHVLFNYEDVDDSAVLKICEGDVLHGVQDRDENGWCMATLGGKSGLVPADYIKILD